MQRWTKANQQFVSRAIDRIAKKQPGGVADIARKLGLPDRRTVWNWKKRGEIPLGFHAKIIRMARPEMQLKPGMLHRKALAIAERLGGAKCS